MLRKSILQALIYFDIFNHPLTIKELHFFLPEESDIDSVANEISKMNSDGIVTAKGGLISVQNIDSISVLRKERNERANGALVKASKMSKIIYRFPFVKSVFISGSLSKGVMDPGSDIDFFVITETGRLWICRTLLMLFKKVFLFNSRKYFCINYFIDTNHLSIEEKNRFTATELITLIPLQGNEFLKKLIDCNQWIYQYFPNYKFAQNLMESERPDILFEKLLRLKYFNWIESFCLWLHVEYWRFRYKPNLDLADFELALKSKEGISKSHPLNAQSRIMSLFNERVRSINI